MGFPSSISQDPKLEAEVKEREKMFKDKERTVLRSLRQDPWDEDVASEILRAKVCAIDTEFTELELRLELVLVQILVGSTERADTWKCYIWDLKEANPKALEKMEKFMIMLMKSNVRKLVWDGRKDFVVLSEWCNLKLQRVRNVLDLQVFYLDKSYYILRQPDTSKLPGLGTMLGELGKDLKAIKSRGTSTGRQTQASSVQAADEDRSFVPRDDDGNVSQMGLPYFVVDVYGPMKYYEKVALREGERFIDKECTQSLDRIIRYQLIHRNYPRELDRKIWNLRDWEQDRDCCQAEADIDQRVPLIKFLAKYGIKEKSHYVITAHYVGEDFDKTKTEPKPHNRVRFTFTDPETRLHDFDLAFFQAGMQRPEVRVNFLWNQSLVSALDVEPLGHLAGLLGEQTPEEAPPVGTAAQWLDGTSSSAAGLEQPIVEDQTPIHLSPFVQPPFAGRYAVQDWESTSAFYTSAAVGQRFDYPAATASAARTCLAMCTRASSSSAWVSSPWDAGPASKLQRPPLEST